MFFGFNEIVSSDFITRCCLPWQKVPFVTTRLSKVSQASSTLYNLMRAKSYRVEILKLGLKPNRGLAQLSPSPNLMSLCRTRLGKLVQLGKM